MNQIESRIQSSDSNCSTSCFRWSLPGEYVSLGLAFHAGVGCCVWGVAAIRSPASCWMVPVALWIILRALGFFSSRSLSPIFTVALIVSLLTLPLQEFYKPFEAQAVFSVPIFVFMLSIIFLADIIELVVPRGGLGKVDS